jgi:hypothetical protein
MNVTLKMCFVLLWLVAFNVQAMEKQKLVFSAGPGKKPDVSFEFSGRVLAEALELLQKDPSKDVELKKFQAFFKTLYDANKNGGKKDVLAIWNPDERKAVEQGIDEKSEVANKARFQSLTAMRLKMIMAYADYYICYIEMVFEGEKTFVMKFPLMTSNNNLYLTNKLNGDYFYDNISHHLLNQAHYQFKTQ